MPWDDISPIHRELQADCHVRDSGAITFALGLGLIGTGVSDVSQGGSFRPNADR